MRSFIKFNNICRVVADGLSAAPKSALPVIAVIPLSVSEREIEEILHLRGIAGVVVVSAIASELGRDDRIGVILDDGDWVLPAQGAKSLLLIEGAGMVALRRSRTALRAGVSALLLMDACANWRVVSIRRWFCLRIIERLSANIRRIAVQQLGTHTRWLERRVQRRLLNVVQRHQAAPRDHFAVGRIMLVNSSLAAGGAERQLVNTVLSLVRGGHEVLVMCHYLGTKEHEFYKHFVDSVVPVFRVRSLAEISSCSSVGEFAELRNHLGLSGFNRLSGLLPPWVVDDVVSYAAEFLVRRPAVVHLWQDYTNVVGGLAAVLAGVPRIVLSMRNMAPFRFEYFQPFLSPIYRILAQHPNVVMLNNSAAGARDYEGWLGLAPGAIRVLSNGIDEMVRPDRNAVERWREQVGLPIDVPVVGSVFRFWPEKDPLLWIRVAAMVATDHPKAVFLLVGAGPMEGEILALAKTLGIADRLYTPGTEKNPYLALAAMDVFLLTSKVEGTPNVLIEAQMLGCPVVTTVAGGSAETVDDGKTGWVVAERDPKILAMRVSAVLREKAWAEEARRTAPDFAKRRFGLQRMVTQTLENYGLRKANNAL